MRSRGRFLYIYEGLGAKPTCLRALLRCLDRWAAGSQYTVKTISPQQILAGEWQEKAALLAIGGGFDRGFVRTLGTRGQEIIRAYVENGGSFLGLCAGGYFGCDYVDFDRTGPLRVCGHRQLKFFPGECCGPAFPGFMYDSETGSRAARLLWNVPNVQSSPFLLHCYYNGGGFFRPNKSKFPKGEHTTLAVYEELPGKPAAVVKCDVGRGVAILSGVHIEHGPHDLDPEDKYSKGIIPVLERDNAIRHLCLQSVVSYLNLDNHAMSKI